MPTRDIRALATGRSIMAYARPPNVKAEVAASAMYGHKEARNQVLKGGCGQGWGATEKGETITKSGLWGTEKIVRDPITFPFLPVRRHRWFRDARVFARGCAVVGKWAR